MQHEPDDRVTRTPPAIELTRADAQTDLAPPSPSPPAPSTHEAEPAPAAAAEGGPESSDSSTSRSPAAPAAGSVDADAVPSTTTAAAAVAPPASTPSPVPVTPSVPLNGPTPSLPATTTTATTTTATTTTKRFSSSLSVNKKFLEKAGEKAHKPEPKLATSRLSSAPVSTQPVSTSHPRLLTGKISSSTSPAGSTIHLSTKPKLGGGATLGASGAGTLGGGGGPAGTSSSSASSSSGAINWSKKPASGTGVAASDSSNSAVANGAGGAGTGGAVWNNTAAAAKPAAAGSGPGMTTKVGTYGGIGLGRNGGFGRGGGGGFNLAEGDFPTAAEAAHAKEARAKAVMEQMQARERALQARAAAAAAQNANLLQNLDAFRGVHLDPNAHHWDEDEDDFLDTTIEFGDGTQYKITEEDAAAAQHQEEATRRAQLESRSTSSGGRADDRDALREPSPSELARLETPLGPGEVEETMTKSREERFGDDYDRSWPPKRPPPPATERIAPTAPASAAAGRHGDKDDANRNLFNDRLGKFEPAQHGQGHASAATAGGRRRLSSGADRSSQDLPPHLAARRDASGGASAALPPRRPSVTQKHHEPAPPPAARSAWPRRPSNELPAPSHGRQLPPHLAAAAAAPSTSASKPASTAPQAPSSQGPPPPPANVLSPPRPLAPLPEASPAPSEPAPTTTEADLEALHAREMHAAAERAKKRRQEEEQARLEQIERAKKKAADLEEKMRQKEVVPPPSTGAKVDDKAKDKSDNPWRTTAKPPSAPAARPADAPTQPALVTPRAPSSSAPTKGTQPTAILPRPLQEKVPPALPPNQPSTWRRQTNPILAASPSQQRQVPPHLAQRQPPPEPPAPTVTSPPPPADDTGSASLAPVASAATIDRPSTPPPPVQSPPSAPSSPSHERKSSAKANPLGYKVPEVSQLDDLMSRIKGAMTVKEAANAQGGQQVDDEVVEDEDEQGDTVPMVKLPAPTPSAKLPRSRSSEQALASTATLPTEPRGRGRGRSEAPRGAHRTAAVATFENRDPVLTFSGTRRARSPSPPPAWKAYAVRIPPRAPLKAPHFRNVKQFLSLHNPRPVPVVFSSSVLVTGINPRRLSRDEILIPKKWVKGVPQYPVKIPSERERITRRTPDEERKLAPPKPTPTVSIAPGPSGRGRATTAGPTLGREGDLANENATSPVDAGALGSRGRGKGRAPDSGSWRRAGEDPSEADASAPSELAQGAARDVGSVVGTGPDSLPRDGLAGTAALKSKLPLGSSIGFYRPPGASPLGDVDSLAMDRSESAKMFMVTSELNGEKIAATPREETTAPGADLASRTKMTPSSPPFKPKDVSSVLSSPSAAWTNKSLALSVLDPTASSVWSAAPVDSTVHARTISENQPENSLQGIVDDDPSEALPSSLAELRSEDGRSDEGKEAVASRPSAPSKDDAKLRAVAPSFSSFLHDSAAAIDSSAALPPISSFPISQQSHSHHRPQPPLAFPGFAPSHHSIPPPSTPSPVNPYSPSTAAYPSYGPAQYARSYGSTAYGSSSSGVSVSPFLSQPPPPHHQHFAPASPVASPLGYPPSVAPGQSPNLYARALPASASPAVPHGITNPALLANYNNGGGYGAGQHLLNSAAARYGAVGAGPRPANHHHAPPPQQQQQHRPSYGGPAYPSTYLGSSTSFAATGGGGGGYRPVGVDPYSSAAAPGSGSATTAGTYSVPAALPTSSYDYPPAPPTPTSAAAGGARTAYGGGGASSGTTTMPSPVIVPQHLPPPPPFLHHQQHAPHHQHHHHYQSSPSSSSSHSHYAHHQYQQYPSHGSAGGGTAYGGGGGGGGGGAMRVGTNRFASDGGAGGAGGARPW